MKPPDPKARSLQALQKAVDRSAREQARSAPRGPEPWPGDLYMLSGIAGLDVEWLVVERAPSGDCRLVAADTDPDLGSADVPVPAESEGGPLSVRCAVRLEIGVETLRRGDRTGAVAPESLAEVRRRLDRAEPESPQRSGLRRIPAASLAAILLLLVALGAVSALAWRFHRGEVQARSEAGRLAHERGAPPRPAAPLVNLAYASFYPAETRGTAQAPKDIAIPGAATHLLLVLYAGHQEPCADYELEIARHGAPAAAPITVRGLRLLPGDEVSAALPREQVPDGLYQLRLYGLCGTERRPLGDYGARLKASP